MSCLEIRRLEMPARAVSNAALVVEILVDTAASEL